MTVRIDNPLALIRLLQGAPISVFLVLLTERRRCTNRFLEMHSGYSDKPISKALDYLKELGLVDHNSWGWMLTALGAQQLPLMMPLLGALEPGAPPDPVQPLTFQEDPEPVQVNSESDGPSRRNSDPSSKKEEEVNNNKTIDSSSYLLNSDRVGENPDLQRIRRVLDAAGSLFEHEIVGDPQDYADLDRLLAWITQAWHRHGEGRGKVSSPAGLIYWAFHQGLKRSPEKKYFESTWQDRILPESFMRESGIWIFEDDPEAGDE